MCSVVRPFCVSLISMCVLLQGKVSILSVVIQIRDKNKCLLLLPILTLEAHLTLFSGIRLRPPISAYTVVVTVVALLLCW
jgi:hypothetical protein